MVLLETSIFTEGLNSVDAAVDAEEQVILDGLAEVPTTSGTALCSLFIFSTQNIGSCFLKLCRRSTLVSIVKSVH